MAIIAVYVTQTEPPLTLRLESDGVVLDNVADASVPPKRLYPVGGEIFSAAMAKEVFDYTEAHFTARDCGDEVEYVRA